MNTYDLPPLTPEQLNLRKGIKRASKQRSNEVHQLLRKALGGLRRAGYKTVINKKCCVACTLIHMTKRYSEKEMQKYIFVTRYDHSRMMAGDEFYLGWRGDDRAICEHLEKAGLKIRHTIGDVGHRICIEGKT